jgi:hypothetical protein
MRKMLAALLGFAVLAVASWHAGAAELVAVLTW